VCGGRRLPVKVLNTRKLKDVKFNTRIYTSVVRFYNLGFFLSVLSEIIIVAIICCDFFLKL